MRLLLLHSLVGFHGSAVRDPVLGRLPKPGIVVHEPGAGMFTIGEHSIRLNRNPPVAERPTVLAVGDSFTFGQDVGDAESWPAALERRLGSRVVNGGVNAFGLDQTVLRAERLSELYAPDALVVGFIPHNVMRCEYSWFLGHPKPYFTLDGDGLRQHAPPVPRSWLTPLRDRLLATSMAAYLFEHSLVWEGPAEELVHDDGQEVACRLMRRLADLGRARGMRVVVLAQAQDAALERGDAAIKDRVLACARANGLATVDLFPLLADVAPGEREQLFKGHMTPAGNKFVADALAPRLRT
jgi:lysophospholipase L1-like esterase